MLGHIGNGIDVGFVLCQGFSSFLISSLFTLKCIRRALCFTFVLFSQVHVAFVVQASLFINQELFFMRSFNQCFVLWSIFYVVFFIK